MQEFGWKTGAYGTLAQNDPDSLPPNIAIMCPTPVISGVRSPDAALGDEQVKELDDMNGRMYVSGRCSHHSLTAETKLGGRVGYNLKAFQAPHSTVQEGDQNFTEFGEGLRSRKENGSAQELRLFLK